MFFGKTKHNLDDKGRLALPSKFRKQIKGAIFLNIDLTKTYLEIMTKVTHQKKQDLLNSFNELDLEAQKIKIIINAQTYEVKIDSNGRINIPNDAVKTLKLAKKVVVIGNGDRITLWGEKSYNQTFEKNKIAATKEIAKIAKRLSDKAYDNK